MKRLLEQFEGKAKREYSAGRIAPDDDGDIAFGIAADPQHKRVIVRFGKPVEWIGFPPEQAIALAEMLIAKAREVSGKPITVKV